VIPTEAVGAALDVVMDDGHNGIQCRPDRNLEKTVRAALGAALPHLRPLVEAQELRLATEVALKLGRQEAAERIRAEIAALPTHDLEGEPIVALDVRSAASDIARRYRDARDAGKGNSA
jgi:hypothetical protein